MRVAILQFNPTLGAVEQNLQRATALLKTSDTTNIDLLVLPELAFTGYNFPDLEAIKPYLEPTAAGPSTHWAIATAQREKCAVLVGYPEIHTDAIDGTTTNYNATVTVSPDGTVLNHYRKSFLYYTDETWASEGPGPSSTSTTTIDTDHDPEQQQQPFFIGPLGTMGTVGHGICMDINPYRFTAPWSAYEFANRMLESKTKLVILSMAWLTRLLPADLALDPDKPDMETVAYWLERLYPFLEPAPAHGIVVVFANRCGVEGNRLGSVQVEDGEAVVEGDRVCYAGSSCVMRFHGGSVRMYERKAGQVAVMGKGEEGVLVVNTAEKARVLLQHSSA